MENKNKKVGLFKKIEQSYIIKIIICVVLCSIVLGLFFIFYKVIPVKYNYTITNDLSVINQIEHVNLKDNKINISGYAFLLDMDSDNSKISVLLRSVDDGKEIWANIEQTSRLDVDSYFNGSYDYKNSGFNATVKEKKLNTDECYEIIVKLDYVTRTINAEGKNVVNRASKAKLTNRYIMNGELYSYNPYKFDQPDMNIESELLREVFTNGQLCFYQKEAGIYVYLYNDKLYWIANEFFSFEEDDLTYIQYQLYTSQTDKLPEDRIQYGFDNIGFNFEEHEFLDENTTPYRVAVRDIPNDYPIAYILTGVYDSVNGNFLWEKYFHINHAFE